MHACAPAFAMMRFRLRQGYGGQVGGQARNRERQNGEPLTVNQNRKPLTENRELL